MTLRSTRASCVRLVKIAQARHAAAQQRVYMLNRRIVKVARMAPHWLETKQAHRARAAGRKLIEQATAANARLTDAFYDLVNLPCTKDRR